MNDVAQEDIVRVVTRLHPLQAHIYEQALKEEGIACRVVGDYLQGVWGELPGPTAEVWVHNKDLERATAIVEHVTATVPASSDTAEEGGEEEAIGEGELDVKGE